MCPDSIQINKKRYPIDLWVDTIIEDNIEVRVFYCRLLGEGLPTDILQDYNVFDLASQLEAYIRWKRL